VTTASRNEAAVRASEQRCHVCDADVLFLSTCLFCGTAVRAASGPDPLVLPAVVPPAPPTLPAGAPRAAMASAPGAARAAARGAIPDELTRAWERNKERSRQTPRGSRQGPNLSAPLRAGPVAPASARTGSPNLAPGRGSTARQRVRDEWVAVPPRTRLIAVYASRLRRALAIVLVLALATGGVIAAMAMSHKSAPVAAAAQHHYDAGGWTFAADFPSTPSVTRFRSSLGGKPYTATFFSAASHSFDMVVGVYPFPIGKPVTSARTFLRRELTGPHHSPVSVRLRPGTSTTVQGLPSVWLAPTLDAGSMASFGVIVLDGHVAYEIVVKGPSSTADATLKRTLLAFRIVDPARATVF